MINWKYARRFDWLLLVTAVALMAFGIFMIRGVEMTAIYEARTVRQSAYAALGLVVFIAAVWIDYRIWARLWKVIYIGLLGLLGAVLVAGSAFGGARSSFDLKLFRVEPSEMAKVLLVIVLASYMSSHDMRQVRHLLITLGMTVVVMGLIFVEPNLGGALLLAPIWLVMAFVAGMRVWHAATLGLAAVAAIPISLRFLEGYQLDRIITFLDPSSDASGKGYNTIQALIAIGSGGWTGQGYGQGLQSQLHYLRQPYTDYMFSVMAEELGFVGVSLFIIVVTLLLLRLIRASSIATDDFGRLLAVGIAFNIFLQTALHIAVNLNLVPTTGEPLPFISFGGSSLVTFMFGLGIVESVVMRRKMLEFDW
ncbi:MAG: FtsW/RodA/SpoVE family cell cycle protein [Anaerolineae bacterium]